MKAPILLVVAVAIGEATTPQGMLVAVCAARQVEGFGVVPTVTVKPARAERDVNSSSVPVKLGDAVGYGDGDGDGDGFVTGVVAELPPPPHPESRATAHAAAP